MDLRRILEVMIAQAASDLHLRVGSPPVLRIHGHLKPLDHPPLRKEEMDAIAEQLLTPGQKDTLARVHEVDFAFGISGLARFRANFYAQRGTMAAAIRSVPLVVPSLEQLNLPAVVGDLAGRPRGMILVTGTVGSGKSTTLAAMINLINRTDAKNIIMVEDPIEFMHRDLKSVISQREVGQDTPGYLAALTHILRQDPDVILIGEIRDRDTMSVALMSADTGHLVLTTLHTADAAQTVNRIISFYPPHQHEEVRYLLASSLQAVISMRLIPRLDGQGRVPAVEVMINTETIRECLQDSTRTAQIRSVIAEGASQYGMQTFDQSLMELYRRNLISMEEALRHASMPTEFALRLKGIQASSDATWKTFESSSGQSAEDRRRQGPGKATLLGDKEPAGAAREESPPRERSA